MAPIEHSFCNLIKDENSSPKNCYIFVVVFTTQYFVLVCLIALSSSFQFPTVQSVLKKTGSTVYTGSSKFENDTVKSETKFFPVANWSG